MASLLLDLGEPVVVVTLASKPEWRRDVETRGATVFVGDATDLHVLQAAGLDEVRAVIACSNIELTNIEIAMDVKRVRPGLRVVLRVFDHALARNVEASLGVESAFAMSSIAAPAFAEAAVGEHVAAAFEVEGRRFSVSRHDLEHSGVMCGRTPAELEREKGVRVLAHLHPDRGFEMPDAEMRLESGEAFVFGEDDVLSKLSALSPGGTLARSSRPGMGDFLRRLWLGSSPELRTVFLALNLLVLLGVLVFWFGMGLSPLDAIYFVVTTVTTTGYGDITPRDAPIAIKLFGILLMFVGSAMIATLYSILTDFIVHARLQQLVGRQRVPDKGHVVVAGLGNVGFRVVQELLRKKVRLAVIEQDPNGRFVESIRSQAPVVIGDAREPETLLRAGVAKCSALIAVTADDSVNLSVGLTTARLAPNAKRVLRIFDADFASKVQKTFEFDAAMSASRIAAPSFVGAALYGKCLAAFVRAGRFFALTLGETEPGEHETASSANVQVNDRRVTVSILSRALTTPEPVDT